MEVWILGYLIVLAVEAAEVAAHRGNGIRPAAGHKMKERFFFDGITIFGNQPTVHQAVQRALLIFPHPADTSFTLLDVTMVIA
jgi:hypothetical protein